MAYNHRGIAYSKKRQYDRGIADLDTAIRLVPDRANSYFNRGNLYEKQGRMEAALRDYRRAYDLGDRSKGMVEKLKQHGRLP